MKRAPRLRGSPVEAKAYALKLLGYRARSRKEMLERLRGKGFAVEDIEKTVQYLEDLDLINDETLASDLFVHAMNYKSLGEKGIRTFLIQRGIDRTLIDRTMSAHTPDMEEKTAMAFIERKIRSLGGHPEEAVRRRLWGMLRRRGISGEVIKRVIESTFQEDK